MRRVTVTVDEGQAQEVARLAFAAGAARLERRRVEEWQAEGGQRARVEVALHLPAPEARRFVAGLDHLPKGSWALTTVHPRAIFTGASLKRDTRPFPVPGLEIEADLWEFSHITASLALRVVLAAVLVAHGMVTGSLPVMLAGLLFLPYHHALLAVALGAVRRNGGLVGHGAAVFALTTLLIALSGGGVGWAEGGAPSFAPAGTPVTALAIGAVVGVAAALGSCDDAGRRELIGLAATAHLSVLPIWAGLAWARGLSGGGAERVVDFALAVATVTLASGVTFAFCGAGRGTPPN